MTRAEAIYHLENHSTTHGSGLTTDKQHNEAKRMAIEALSQEPTEDCISRQAAIDAIPNPWLTSDGNIYNTINIVHKIMDLPSVQPKHGKWKIVLGMNEQCSECGKYFPVRELTEHRPFTVNYCPNCGSCMDKPTREKTNG